MPLGILEDNYLKNVPGTVSLLDVQSEEAGITFLKHKKSVDSRVILAPQPSDDPRDPLNWPRWRKECIFWILSFGAGLVGAIGHLLNPGFVVLSKEWGVSVDTVAATNNTLILALGCIMLVQAPLAVKYGRRPVYIVAALILFCCSIWSALSQGLNSFTASRVFQGIGEAPFEALVTATIADVYFVHQRGLRTAIWSFAITAGINIGPIVNGYIIDSRLGWRFCFWLITIAFGFLLAGIVFFVPETTYDRDSKFETDIKPGTLSGPALENDAKKSLDEKADSEPVTMTVEVPKRNFIQELSPWNGYVHHDNLFKLFLRPLPFLFSPVVWYGIFIYGLTVVWLDVLNVITATVFSLPPYRFSASQTGLVSIGPLIGSIVAAVISGPLCDYATTEFARRNNGIYEPESRLFLLIPMFILQVFGYMGWALMAPHDVHWMGPVMMFTIINVGQGIGTTGAVAYIIDVHRKNVAECFALINFVKDVILYGFARFANSWVADMGVLRTFGILAGLSALCIMTTIPMYIYGKRARSFVARHHRLFLIQ